VIRGAEESFGPLPRATISPLPDKPIRRFPAGRGLAAAVVAGVLILPGRAAAHGSLHEQIDAVTKAIAANPGDARLYVKRGELHRFHGQLAAALADYVEASRLDPSLPEADLGRGRALLDANRAGRAHEPLVRFLHARPDHAEGRLALARCLGKLGRGTEAAVEYTRAATLFSRPSPDVYLERARVLAAAGRTEEAIRGLDEAIARLGPLVALEETAIELELRRRSWDAALARVDRVAAASQRRESWMVRRAEILLAAGRDREAREAYVAARTAIDSLPPRLRRTRAMERLDRKVRSSLEHSSLKETNDAHS
jgi:predicted Zn-dependent protease